MSDEKKSREQLLTELEALRERLVEAEAKKNERDNVARELAAFVYQAPVGAFRVFPEGQIEMANPALLEMLGLESFEDLRSLDLLKGNDMTGKPGQQFLLPLQLRGQVQGLEVAWTRPDGEIAYLNLNARAVHGHKRKLLYYEGTVEDFTERKAAERRVRESEQKYRMLIEALPHGVGIIQDGKLVFANTAAARLLGFEDRDQLAGQKGTVGLAERERERVVPMLRRAIDDDGPWPQHYAATAVRLDGSEFPVEMYATGMRYEDRPALQLAMVDVSEQRRMAQERQRLVAQLHQTDKMSTMGQLAASVAHQINTPVGFMMPNIDMLQQDFEILHGLANAFAEGADREQMQQLWDRRDLATVLKEVPDMLEECREGLVRIRNTTRELRQFTRLEDTDAHWVELSELLEPALGIAGNQIQCRARLTEQYGATPKVRTNRSRLGQVLLSLVVHAVHAIPEGAVQDNWLRVTTGRAEEGVFVEIAHTGAAMTDGAAKAIVEGSVTAKPGQEQASLGLAICSTIVQQLGGQLQVQSGEGRETVFRVTLPAGEELPNGAISQPPFSEVADPSGRVLIIDDEAGLRHALSRQLAGYNVELAAGGPEALEVLASNQDFVAVLCDLMMPDVNGIEVYERTIEAHPELAQRFVFMTAGTFTERAEKFVQEVDRPVLDKPIGTDDLRRAIGRAARGKGS